MKKFRLLYKCAALAAAAALSLQLVGCGEQNGLRKNNPTVVTLWHYYNSVQKNVLDEMIEKFNSTVGAERGIIVEASGKGSIDNLTSAIFNAADKVVGSEPMPDMFAAYVDTALAVDKLNMLASIDDYLTDGEIAEYRDNYIDEGRIGENNNLKVLPIAKSSEVMMLNTTAWEPFAAAEGLTYDNLSTWEGVTETAEKYYNYTDLLTEAPNDGKAFFGRDAYANYMIIGSLQLGQEIFAANNGKATANLDKAVMRRLWDNLYVPFVNGWFAKNGRFASDDAKTGDIIAMVCSTAATSYFPTKIDNDDVEPYPIEGIALPLPNFADAEPCAVQQGAGMAVTKSDKTHEYACVVFLRWLTEKEQNCYFALKSGYMPVKKDVTIDDILNAADEHGIELDEVMLQSMHVAMEQTEKYRLYTNRPFDNGYAARQLLETSMLTRAQEDLKAINSKLSIGTPRGEAVNECVSDENFDDWYKDLTESIADVLNK